MKLISLNIELNKHTDVVLAFLKKENPDVICLQEMLETDFPRYKKELELEGIFKASSYRKPDPYYKDLEGKKYGVAIFAKNIVDSGFSFYIGKEENILKPFKEHMSDERFKENKVLVWIDTRDIRGNQLRFVTTHFTVTKFGESTAHQLENLNSLFKMLDSFSEFVLVADMNAPRGKETFSRLAKKYKDNIPLKYETSLDQKLHRIPGLMHMVDCLFTTPAYQITNVKLVDGLSDHMAIIADIGLNQSK